MKVTLWPTKTPSSISTPSQMKVWLEILQFFPTFAFFCISTKAPIFVLSPIWQPYRLMNLESLTFSPKRTSGAIDRCSPWGTWVFPFDDCELAIFILFRPGREPHWPRLAEGSWESQCLRKCCFLVIRDPLPTYTYFGSHPRGIPSGARRRHSLQVNGRK